MTSAEIMRESIAMFFHSGITFSFAISTIIVGLALIFFMPDYLTKGQKNTLRNLSIVFTPYVIYIIYVLATNGWTMPIY
ncbi:MAG: hypothetical protein IJN84_05260 [Clostridia bacterium]|nr:hypothetical protein [Clostridia bacterium]